jgi:hypothetical protein
VDAIEPSHTSADAGMIERESTEPSHTLKLPWSFSLWSQATISSQPSLGDARELSLSSSTGSEWFDDWLEANDMATSVYIALTMEPSSSHQVQTNVLGQLRSRSYVRAPRVDFAFDGPEAAHR